MAKGARPPELDLKAQHVRASSFVLAEHGSFRNAALDAARVRKGEPYVAV